MVIKYVNTYRNIHHDILKDILESNANLGQ
jgi:hypothetical protein